MKLSKLYMYVKKIDSLLFKGKLFRRAEFLALKHVKNHYPPTNLEFLKRLDTDIESALGIIKYAAYREMAIKDIIYLQYNNPYLTEKDGRYDIPKAYLDACNGSHANDEKEVINLRQDGLLLEQVDNLVWLLQTGQDIAQVRVNYIQQTNAQKLLDGTNIPYRPRFSEVQQHTLDKSLESLLAKCKQSYKIILWPSAKHFWNTIVDDIKSYDKYQLRIVSTKDYVFTEEELGGFIEGAYFYAAITKDLVEYKKRIILDASEKTGDEYCVRILDVEVDNPYYEIDVRDGQPVSKLMNEFKRNLRAKYEHRVSDYKYDNIIHSTDNSQQTSFVTELLKINCDISGLYNRLKSSECKVALIKRTKSYAPLPTNAALNNRFVFSKDIDFLTTDDDFDQVCCIIKTWAEEHFASDCVDVSEERVDFNNGEKYNRFIWVKIDKFEVLLFHIQSRLYDLTEDFLKESLRNKHIDGIQSVIDAPEHEIYMRIAELLVHPNKEHHIEYVKHYKSVLSKSGVEQAFGKKADKAMVLLHSYSIDIK